MRVQFEATLDDMVDAALKALSRSRSFSPYRWLDNFAGSHATFGDKWTVARIRKERLTQ